MITMLIKGTSHNSGASGFAAHLICGEYEKIFSGNSPSLTNNAADISALITGLKAMKGPKRDVMLYTCSDYIARAINEGYIKEWIANDWRGKYTRIPIANKELWQEFIILAKAKCSSIKVQRIGKNDMMMTRVIASARAESDRQE